MTGLSEGYERHPPTRRRDGMAQHKDEGGSHEVNADSTVGHRDVEHRDEVVHESRSDVVGREREEHGGVKIGSAFFGWLTATGMTVLLFALAAAVGTAVSVATGNETVREATDAATSQAGT